MHVIDSENLEKNFGSFAALKKLSLQVTQGECLGLLGPNGAGKSTFINLIYGALPRTGGKLSVFGMDPQHESSSIKESVGVVTQENALDESLSVNENMLIYSAFLGIPFAERQKRVSELLEYMNLTAKSNSPIQTLSGGMKRRLVFVRALLGQPRLLILDEPTTGLDPGMRHLLWGKVRELRAKGTTILLTTHYIHEAEALCDRVAILHQGELKELGTPAALIAKYSAGFVAALENSAEDKVQKICARFRAFSFLKDQSGLYLRAPNLDSLLNLAKTDDLTYTQLRPGNLEDVFLSLTGQEIAAE